MKTKRMYKIRFIEKDGSSAYSGMIFTDLKQATQYAASLSGEEYMIEEIEPAACGGYWWATILTEPKGG